MAKGADEFRINQNPENKENAIVDEKKRGNNGQMTLWKIERRNESDSKK